MKLNRDDHVNQAVVVQVAEDWIPPRLLRLLQKINARGGVSELLR